MKSVANFTAKRLTGNNDQRHTTGRVSIIKHMSVSSDIHILVIANCAYVS